MEKIKSLIKKICTKEVILYVIFGIITTIINIVTFKILNTVFHVEENLSNNIAIILAVLTAYFTNRKFVFNSTAVGFKARFVEFAKFIGSRAITMLVESSGFYLMFNVLGIDKDISKIAITIIVIILNYFFSKFFTFKKHEEKK